MARQAMLRILAIPLRRPVPSATTFLLPLPRVMTYYQFQLNKPKPVAASSQSKYLPEGGILHWTQNKVADTWTGFGKAKEGSWQLKLFQYGERLVDRIDFEELALKGIDPSLGPSLSPLKDDKPPPHVVKIPLVYPSTILSGDSSLAHLKSLVSYRIPNHRKRFWIYLLVAPLTAPFMIIPVIPNIPFFFCVWRSWSHYKAFKASEYLQALLDRNIIVPEVSSVLETIYDDYAPKALPPPEPVDTVTPEPPFGEQVLLTREAIPIIRTAFELGSTAEADLYRAMEQARVRPHV